jgi:hypothetical protein
MGHLKRHAAFKALGASLGASLNATLNITLTTALWLCCTTLPAQAALYRCPSPFADGLVVTNIVNDVAASERGCEPLQQRRSALDGPAQARTGSAANPAARLSDDWIAPRRTVSGHANHPAAPKAADTGELRADVKRVDTAQQRSRDADRKRILQAELDTELQAHQILQNKPANDGAQREEHSQRAQRHAANIDALRRELSRVP